MNGTATLDAMIDALAERVADLVVARIQPAQIDDGWMTATEAATYLGVSVHAVHRLTAAREIPFSQHAPGARCFFRRSDLNDWRDGHAIPSVGE